MDYYALKKQAIQEGFYTKEELEAVQTNTRFVLVTPEAIEALRSGAFTKQELLSPVYPYVLASIIAGKETLYEIKPSFSRYPEAIQSIHDIVDNTPNWQLTYLAQSGRFLFMKHLNQEDKETYVQEHCRAKS